MAKRSTPKPKVDMNDPAVKVILAVLLADFKARGLNANDLHDGYEGPPPTEMREQYGESAEYSDVDYDLAFSVLLNAEYIKTGPMKMYDNDPNSGVFIMAFFSENKFTHLTMVGYQEASRMRLVKPPRASSTQHVHISGGTFHNSPIGIGHAVSQTFDLNTATTDQIIDRIREEVRQVIADQTRQQEVMNRLDALQAAHDQPTRMDRYMQVMGAIGDHITVLSFLLTPLLHSLQH